MTVDTHTVDILLEPESDGASLRKSGFPRHRKAPDSNPQLAPPKKRGWAFPMTFCRILARLIDMHWQGIVVWWLINTFVAWPELTQLNQLLILLFAVLPSILLIDVVVHGILGNTPGKKLLGIQVLTWDGDFLTLKDAFERNFLLWRFGFLFGLPLLPFTLISQYRRLSRGGRTHYDDQLHLRIKQYDRPVLVNLITAAAAVLILFFLFSGLFLIRPY